jgi:alanyl-tRNA synthetase
MLTSEEIRKKFIEFMKSKNHKEAPNASLIPLNDPSVLFTTAGMHPLVPYLMGQPHPLGKRLTNVQRCIRTDDIDEVGNTTHLTFFEMLGFWSLGDYFKEFAIKTTFEFLTSEKYLGLDPNRIYATVFEGNEQIPLDEQSIEIWKEIYANEGIQAEVYDGKNLNAPKLRIFPLNWKENGWGPAGETGPCGPDTEFFYWRGEGKPDFNEFVPWDTSNMFIEICNDVFMAYNKNKDGTYSELEQKNVDFGGGFERMALISQFKDNNGVVPMRYSVFNTDLFENEREYLESKIQNIDLKEEEKTNAIRIILDHVRSAVFAIADGAYPSNKDQGYITRRLIRRAIRAGKKLELENKFIHELGKSFIESYKNNYPHLKENENRILDNLGKEEQKFQRNTY